MTQLCTNDIPEEQPPVYATKRLTVEAAEALLYVEHPLLVSDVPGAAHGHWALVDYMGGDAAVVDGARTSTNFGMEVRNVRDDRGLIFYLMENAHTSPFEQVSLKFHLKLPLFVFAQLCRTRTAKLNSASARYSVMKSEFYLPSPEQLRKQSTTNKQATEEAADAAMAIEASRQIMEWCAAGYNLYDELLGDVLNPEDDEAKWRRNGIAREQARVVLPQNLFTNIVWKIDLHNLFHFLGLRLDWHAQQEIRVYAEGMAVAARAVAPLCWEAFEEFRLGGARLSATDLAFFRRLWGFYKGEVEDADGNARAALGKRAGKMLALLEAGDA